MAAIVYEQIRGWFNTLFQGFTVRKLYCDIAFGHIGSDYLIR